MKALMDEAFAENSMEVDELFGIPPTIDSSSGSSLLWNDHQQDWRNGDLTQWFDGAIDVVGSHEAAGVLSTRLDNGPPQTVYNPWSMIEEPVVLTQGAPYYVGYANPHGAGEPPMSAINAAEMLQIPMTSGHAAAYIDTWSSKGSPVELTSDGTDELQSDDRCSEVDSVVLAIEILSDNDRNSNLQGDDVKSNEESQEVVATSHAAYKKFRSSTCPQDMMEYSMQSAGIVQPPIRSGSGRVSRKNMTQAWSRKGNSTFIIPDDTKMREGRDKMMFVESGPRDTLQPMQRFVQPGGSRWAEQLLNLCAGAIVDGNVPRIQHLMWVLNELGSMTGDGNERLAAYGLKALFCRLTKGEEAEATWTRPFHHQEKTLGPKAVHKALVTFHEFNPWHQIAYTVTNDVLMDVFAGRSHLHIVDVGVIKGLQWPTLIDALSNRPGGPPMKLRITTIRHHTKWAPYTHNDQVDAESAEFMRRLVTFAKGLGLNCELNMYVGPLECFRKEDLKLEEGETLAVCCQYRLHRLSNVVAPRARHSSCTPPRSPRDEFLELIYSLKPHVFVVSENDVDMLSDDFLIRFKEIIRFWWLFYESTDLSFKGRESEARRIVEYEGSMIMLNAIACEGRERIERNDRQESWIKRIRRAGFMPLSISENTKKAVRVELQRNDAEHWRVSYSLLGTNCANLLWKDQTTCFTSLWKTPTCSRKLCNWNEPQVMKRNNVHVPASGPLGHRSNEGEWNENPRYSSWMDMQMLLFRNASSLYSLIASPGSLDQLVDSGCFLEASPYGLYGLAEMMWLLAVIDGVPEDSGYYLEGFGGVAHYSVPLLQSRLDVWTKLENCKHSNCVPIVGDC